MKLFNSSSSYKNPMINSGKVAWRSPSNIALIKYWGKKEYQLPSNASLSFTLKNCFTETSIEYSYDEGQRKISYEIIDSEIKNDKKLDKFFKVLSELAPFLNHLSLKIKTRNSFPHSVGIASSASGYSALALCLLDIEKEIFDLPNNNFFPRASTVARLGSGSAARSLYAGFNLWGETKYVSGSTDEYAVNIQEIHKDFSKLKDLICIVDETPKSVSSSQGHELMKEHPYREQRFSQARENLNNLLEILKNGDWSSFKGIIENEALTLHALMMSSAHSYMLMTPLSLKVIDCVKKFQTKENHLTYTMDAGPNVHILYDESFADIQNLKNELRSKVEHIKFIDDEVGEGPVRIHE